MNQLAPVESTALQDLQATFLSALTEAANKVKGLRLGAVDYMTKPFDQARSWRESAAT